MKKLRTMLLTLLATLSFVSCGDGTMTADEIKAKCESGVVMVVNQYYYKVTLPSSDAVWYFTGFDADGDLDNWTTDVNEVMKNRPMLTGTAFFVSSDGKLLTNRHVANPAIKLSDTKKSIRQLLYAISELAKAEMQNLSQRYNQLEAAKEDCYSYNPYDGCIYQDNATLQRIAQEQAQLEQSFNEAEEIKEQALTVDLSDLRVETVSDISIAYNNTYVTKITDLAPCVVTAVSEDEDVDLAMLQLKNKKTPEDKYVFDVMGENDDRGLVEKVKGLFSSADDDELKVEQKLYMIGFNAGFQLSNTPQGIKAQITNGAISQNPDKDKIMYTIPSLPGSSGSPVVNDHGRLVAVNFAGVSGTQGFNYGIQIQQVRRFFKEH